MDKLFPLRLLCTTAQVLMIKKLVISNPPQLDCEGAQFFGSTSLPLASTRWVRLTLSSLRPLF